MGLEIVGWWLMAAIAVACALGMVSTRNPVHSALWLVACFVAVAVIYLLLSAPLLFAIQMIVYAGAIMVLFLFVVMFFMAPSARKWQRPALKSQIAFGALFSLVFVLLVLFAFNFSGNRLAIGDLIEEGETIMAFAPEESGPEVGDPLPLGTWLFRHHVLPFELTSILLLAAILGAMMVARDERSEGREKRVHYAAQADVEGDHYKEPGE
jgi:NADH-quinone oxidoreductase subunit J